MHRFFINENIELGKIYSLSKEESKHAHSVLRLSENCIIELLDGKNIFTAKILKITNNSVDILAMELKPSIEAKTNITLFQGFPKGDKINTIVQKCTEVGIKSIVPVLTKRVVKKPVNTLKIVEKCKRIAIEACKQSGRNFIPIIENIVNFDIAIHMLSNYDIIVVPWENEHSYSLKDIVKEELHGKNIAIFIGPEGGIDESEINILKSINAQIITLGKRILRTETAGECTCFAILSMLNDL